MTDQSTTSADEPRLLDMTVRELTNRFPATMSILAPLGLDLCCGGGHPLGEALALHGADLPATLDALERVIALAAGEG